ncbi:MAG: SLATT domain-containing protein [Bryobacteraceae bacterium]
MADQRSNLRSESLPVDWYTQVEPDVSLKRLFEYVENQTMGARDWYYQKKRRKKAYSIAFRYAALLLSGAAGLLPVALALWPALRPERPDMAVSLMLGVAAALIGLDRFGGFSTGWMRYVRYAMAIDRILVDFRMDWTARLARVRAKAPRGASAAGGAGGGDAAKTAPLVSFAEADAFIDRARQVAVEIKDHVARETAEWAAEFESNLNKLESELKSQWLDREKEVREGGRPGHLFVTVGNALETDDRKFCLRLIGPTGQELEHVERTGGNTWTRLGLAPGMYTIMISGVLAQKPAVVEHMVEVQPGKREDIAVELPK